MPKIDRLRLPSTLPPPSAMKAANPNCNETFYEPDCWELHYHIQRYLEGLDDTLLMERHGMIVSNLQGLVTSESDVIPIEDYRSSWYWFRKEHQARFECGMRGMSTSPPTIDPRVYEPRIRMRVDTGYPGAGDALLRFDKKPILEKVLQGKIRFGTARKIESFVGDPARHDSEVQKVSFSYGPKVTITNPDGTQYHPLGHVKYSKSIGDYYMFCTSREWNEDLFEDFDADACLVINSAEELGRRLETATRSAHGELIFTHFPVIYYDEYEANRNSEVIPGMSKPIRFANQFEYRFIWHPTPPRKLSDYCTVNIGPIDDIATIVRR